MSNLFYWVLCRKRIETYACKQLSMVIFLNRMKVKYVFIVILSVIIGMSSCVHEFISSKFMVFDSVNYVNKFPYTINLKDSKVPEFDIIGINDFCIVDSIILFSHRGSDSLWSVFSLPDYKLLGRCFTKGNGPGEFIQAPRVAFKTDFFQKEGQLFANIYDFQTGKVVQSNISASLIHHKNEVSVLCDSLPSGLFSFISVSDSVFFCKEISPDFTKQCRFMAGKSAGVIPYTVQNLNKAEVDDSKDINIISTIAKMNRINERIVEMPIGLNYINIYSLKGDVSKTVCIGDKLDNISDIEDQNEWSRLYTYADLRLYDDFWGVVSIMEDMKTFQTSRKKHPSILLFNWEGDPLIELKLTKFINSFDIDIKNKILYVFDVYNDKMFSYDISEALEKISISKY